MALDPIKIKQALEAMKNRERSQVEDQVGQLKNPVVFNVDNKIEVTAKIEGKTNEAVLIEKRVIGKSIKKEQKRREQSEPEEQKDEEDNKDEDQDKNNPDEENNDEDDEENNEDEDKDGDDDKDKDERDKDKEKESEGEGDREGEEGEPENEADTADKFHEGQNLERSAAKGAGEAATGEGAVAAGTAGAGTAATGGAAAGGTAAVGGVAASAPIWGTILLIILAFVSIFIVIIVVLIYSCDKSSRVGTFGSYYIKTANILTFGQIEPLAEMNEFCKLASDAGLTTSGEDGIVGNLDIVLSSAYRPGERTASGGPSAHGRGEAVDIALRNPTVPVRSSDPRIAQLVQLGQSVGFVPTVGDTLDEYTNPAENATGGHVHVEFNLKSDGATYCDNTRIPSSGPTDLIPIPSSIPTSGVSDPRLRPCMLARVQAIFDAAASASNQPPTTTP